MGRTGTRLCLGALAVLVAAIGVVATQRDTGPEDVAVGTEGPALDDERRRPRIVVPQPGDDAAEATTTSTVRAGATSRRRTAVATSGTAAPATTVPTAPAAAAADERGPGPQTLLGRVLYIREDSNVAHALWSARLDGGDKRREVACAPPTVPAPSPEAQHHDYWIAIPPFDVSPDGTHVVRSCLVEAPVATGRWDIPNGRWALMVQDVDGVGSTELWRYDLTTHHVYPSFSPDGSQILVWTQEALILINADGTGRRVVETNPSPHRQRFTWSPDGTKVTTDPLEVLDLTTGQWSKPMDLGQPWPYAGGFAAYGVVAWRPDGIWFVSNFTAATGPSHGTEVWGLYHLDPATGVAQHVQEWNTLVSGGELVGQDVYGASHDGENHLVRVGPDGIGHVIPGVTTYGGIHIPNG